MAIIGGGVVGCFIAYHLARRGLRDVVVLERETGRPPGQHVAAWLVDGKPAAELSLFDPGRFARGTSKVHDDGPDAE